MTFRFCLQGRALYWSKQGRVLYSSKQGKALYSGKQAKPVSTVEVVGAAIVTVVFHQLPSHTPIPRGYSFPVHHELDSVDSTTVTSSLLTRLFP
jgi:hypothetical protein